MVRSFAFAAATLLSLSSLALADTQTPCSRDKTCPQDTPCCSSYGFCGLGAYCLGGCDPFSSFSLGSCMPAPVCQSSDFKLNNLDSIVANTEYLGDSSKANWVSSGTPKKYTNGDGDQVVLTMPPHSVGTLLASTQYVWYGRVSAKLKTSRGQGVVTAFILLADSKDEIDFEFVGVDLNTAQSNFYFQAYPDYQNSANLTSKDTFDTYHTYTIDWKPDSISWSVDGNAGRTKYRNETYNSTSNVYNFPQTPARVQLSLWPAGDSANAKGTIAWAGGNIDWSNNAPDLAKPGYYYAMVQDVNVECYKPPNGANVSGSTSYTYNGLSGTNDTVAVGKGTTVMKSFLDSGLNPNANAQSSALPSGSSAPIVPGQSGSGARGGDSSSSSGGGSAGGGSSGGTSGGGNSPSIGGFSQGRTNTAAPQKGEKALQGSLLAVLIAICGVVVM